MYSFDDLLNYFEDNLKKETFSRQPEELYQPIGYTLALGGKRIRPVLTLMACHMFGGDIKDALPQALAIEMFHNFTLIHDDIMDNAPIRRGKKTVYKKWSPNIAILSGDTLFAYAYQFAQKADKEILGDILNVFNQTAIEVCEGQQYDLNFETRNDVSVEEYINMIRLKTAVLFGASLKIGSIIGGAKKEESDKLYNFALNIGLGFQLKDDLLDSFGDEMVFGKKTGGDILTNKKTFLYLKALELATDGAKKQLLDYYSSTDINSQAKVQSVKSIFSSLEVDKITEVEINKYFDKGLVYLNNMNVNDRIKKELHKLASKMIHRTY
ncbi:MAG: polyprenyl synthetase family protein [Chlorobi bacterium]|nr:polyprenyl synthetase family protein [Chlorobiota bacterium]